MIKRIAVLGLVLGTVICAGCSRGRHGVAFRGPHKEVELGYDVEVDEHGHRNVDLVADDND
jgi:hypothetical protein